MNTFFRLTALAGLLALAGQSFAVEDITRADQIPVLKEETQHATVSERCRAVCEKENRVGR